MIQVGLVNQYFSEILGVYFPDRPLVRVVKKVDIGQTREAQCTKNYQSNSRLGGGLLLFWCVEHRMCLGWVVLQTAESLEIVYTSILSRFQKIPDVIIYDNACNLAEYCYNRAPRYVISQNDTNFCSYFSDTIFSVDAFHYAGHTNCSRGYSSTNLMILKDLDTVIHEQKNSLLAFLKITSIPMRFDSWVALIRAITITMNLVERKKIKKIFK